MIISFSAMRAKLLLFLINILNIGARSHHTFRMMTMYEAEGMAHLMDDYLRETFQEQDLVFFHTILFIPEAIKRSNTRVALKGGLTEYIC